jgi:MoaA/NifB/PqqE/SkfB family radical SAM enzyme
MDNKTFCSSLWNHQMIDTTGKVKPCCRFVWNNDIPANTLKDKTIQEIFYSDFMQDLRRDSLQGKPISGCERCYQEQSAGKKSLRERVNSNVATKDYNLDNPKITYLELAISNDCNLMCRMCLGRYSWKLYDEEIEYYGKTPRHEKKTRSNIDYAYELLPNLQYIKFTGGEPLMIKEHWDFLQEAVDKGYAKDITLNYSTNCTVFPKDKHIELWKEFKKIEMAVSLDSIVESENIYQRHLTDHSIAIKTIKKYAELSKNTLPMHVLGRPTVTIMNIYTLPETVEWLDGLGISTNPSHLTNPEWQSVTVLPLHTKQKIKEKYEKFDFKSSKAKNHCMYIINYMMSKDDSHLLDEFIKHTNFLDKKRNQSFKEQYPYFDFL